MRYKYLAIATVTVLALSSCKTPSSVLPYFQDVKATGVTTYDEQAYTPVIQPDDELFITVTSDKPALTSQYNIPAGNPATRAELATNTTPRQLTYVVDSQGDIQFPVLGKLHVAGMTVEQLQNHISELIAKDVPNAIVRVEMVNFTVSVGGEVAEPGTIHVTSRRFTLLDALSAAGDLTPYGRRNNVLIVREDNGQRTMHRVDLTDSQVFSSPYFFLKQNDYIYVEPNDIREANSRYNQDNAYKLTVISTVVSAASVIASLVIALTVK